MAASFVSATMLPSGSEVVLLRLISQYPELTLKAVGVATVGNTLGGMTSFFLGWLLPRHKLSDKAMNLVQRYGYWSLLFSWVPRFGDALCAAVGWLRLNLYLS